jgi:hypothetical protein
MSWIAIFGGTRSRASKGIGITHYSLGNSIRPNIVIKKRKVLIKIPLIVGQPPEVMMLTDCPNMR